PGPARIHVETGRIPAPALLHHQRCRQAGAGRPAPGMEPDCRNDGNRFIRGRSQMNMVDIYVAEVGRNLPKKDRADLEQEIRSLIEDAIDDAAEAQGCERDEALVVEVLKQFGRPEEVAASYS